jgi:hypothetical protein
VDVLHRINATVGYVWLVAALGILALALINGI